MMAVFRSFFYFALADSVFFLFSPGACWQVTDFSVQCTLQFFLVLPRKLYPTVALKLQFLGPLIWRSTLSFRGIDDMPSLFSSRYLGRNGCQADYEKLKITSKRKTIGDFHMMSLKFKATKLSIDPAEILLSRDV